MNKSARRKAAHAQRDLRGGMIVNILFGRLSERDPNYGPPVNCYVCRKTHKGFGLARIEDNTGTTDVPLCEPCLAADDGSVIRKYWNAPDLKISEGGELKNEQVLPMAEKLQPGATEH